MKHREHRLKSRQTRRPKKKARQAVRHATSQSHTRREGIGTKIASRFRQIGLKSGEEIQDLQMQIQLVDSEE